MRRRWLRSWALSAVCGCSLTAAGAVGMGGCAVQLSDSGATGTVVLAQAEPPRQPPPRIESRPKRPNLRSGWVPGYYEWRAGGGAGGGGHYEWTPGRWQERPKGKAHWKDGRWRKVQGGWEWLPGHWE